MLTTDKLKELEDKKKAAIAAIDAEIAKVKELEKAKEELVALVAKYKYPNVTAFLNDLELGLASHIVKNAGKSKSEKTAPSGDTLKKGPFSQVEKDQIIKLHEEGNKPVEIANKMRRSENAIVKILNDTPKK